MFHNSLWFRSAYVSSLVLVIASCLIGTVSAVCLTGLTGSQMVLEDWSVVEEFDEGVLKQEEAEAPVESRHSRILKYREIEPTKEGLGDYLRALQPEHPSQKQLAETARNLIEQLGNPNYRVRQEARIQLGKMTTLPIEELKAARRSKDPEVRASAAMLLEYSKKRAARDSRAGITQAVCSTVIEKSVKGLVSDLLLTMKLFDDDEATLELLQEAVIVSVVEDDAKTLNEMLSREQQSVRITGIRGLANLQKEASSEVLRGLLKDSDENIVLAAARELANLGQRESIAALMELMGSGELKIRIAGHRVMRSLTNQDFKYFAFEKPEARNAAIKRWETWLANDGVEAELFFPLVDRKILLGRILISDYSSGKVIELDLDGKLVWEQDVSSPWAVQGLPNGHRLVGLYTDSAIVEFDAEGNEVAKIEGIPGNVMGFCRLENGSTLVTGSESGKVLEYDQEGTVVWEKSIGGRPTDVKVLDNGNMMVALMDESRIVEIDREGRRLLSIDVAASPMGLQVTERGTFITAHSSQQKAFEYNRSGEVIREIEIEKSVTGAREMSNGDMILATSDAIQRQDPTGDVIWEYKDLTYCYNVSPY